MAIALDSMVLNPTLNQQPRVSSSIKADQATGAFDLADQRIGQQVSATNVQLSAFGQIKSSYADIQSAAKSLSAPGKSATSEDATKTVQAFAEAFNKAAQVVDTALKGNGKIAGALAGDVRANLAGFDLKKILTNENNAADLKKIGISINQDGMLSVDTNALRGAIQANPAAVHETLARIGAQTEQAAGRVLANSGAPGNAVNAVSARARSPQDRATEQEKPASDSFSPAQPQATNPGNSSAGATAYTQMFSR